MLSTVDTRVSFWPLAVKLILGVKPGGGLFILMALAMNVLWCSCCTMLVKWDWSSCLRASRLVEASSGRSSVGTSSVVVTRSQIWVSCSWRVGTCSGSVSISTLFGVSISGSESEFSIGETGGSWGVGGFPCCSGVGGFPVCSGVGGFPVCSGACGGRGSSVCWNPLVVGCWG